MRLPLLAFLAAVAQAAFGQTTPEPTRLVPDAAASGDRAGLAVAASAGRALVGAPEDDGPAFNAGVVLAFERQPDGSWVQAAELAAADAGAEDYFGIAVALDGDRALVGAVYDDDRGDDAGAAYVFERGADGAWTQVAKLTASDGAAGDRLGFSVALTGGRAVVGAYGDGGEAGAAYVFERGADGAWAQAARLAASDGAAVDRFGWSVALSGDRALVGAYLDDGDAADTGSAYVFERQSGGGWVQAAKLTPPGGGGDVHFGAAVALDGGRAIVGAPRDNERADAAGAAYVFERQPGGTWGRAAKLVAPGEAIGLFGTALTLAGDLAVVGAPQDRETTGAAYAFERGADGAWARTADLRASDPRSFGDQFGYRVALSDGTAVVGAFGADAGYGGSIENAGAAYAFVLREPTVAAEDGPDGAPAVRVWPNPSAGPASVSFVLAEGAEVRVAVHDVLGREVAVLADGPRGAGPHVVSLNDLSAPAGPYLIRVYAGARVWTTTLTLVR